MLLNHENGRIVDKLHKIMFFKGAEISWFHLDHYHSDSDDNFLFGI